MSFLPAKPGNAGSRCLWGPYLLGGKRDLETTYSWAYNPLIVPLTGPSPPSTQIVGPKDPLRAPVPK